MSQTAHPRKRDRLRRLLSTQNQHPASAPSTSQFNPPLTFNGAPSLVLSNAPSSPPSRATSSVAINAPKGLYVATVPNLHPTTSTVSQQDFINRVFLLLSQQDQNTIRQHTVSNTTGVVAIVQQAFEASKQKQATCQLKRWTFVIRGHRVVLQEEANKVMRWLDRFKQVGDVASNADPVHLGLPWAGIRLLLEVGVVEPMTNLVAVAEQSQMAALLVGLETALYLSNRLQVYMAYWAGLPASPARVNFEACLVEFHALVLRFLAGAIRIHQKGSVARGFGAFWRIEDVSTFEDQCNKIAHRADIEANNCDRDLSALERAGAQQEQEDLRQVLKQLEAMHIVQTSIEKLETKFDLSKLPVAAGAGFDSHQNELDARCHPDTRVDLLEEIYDWADDVDGKCIFWLRGMAGTGKSTISRTVAQAFADRGQLGASFFFKRGEHDRENASLFFTTIAHDLVRQIPELALHVHKAIDDDPGIARKALKKQFEKLIFQPLTDISPTPPTSLILVIDALDECDREGDVRTILSLLASTRRLSSVSVQVFLTSRPELSIHLGFAQIGAETHRDVVLHDIPPSTIHHDIAVYLESEFKRIRDEHNCLWPADQALAPDWPGRQVLDSLIQSAVPLFIVAATISRFIGDPRGDPPDRLATILYHHRTGQMSQMEQTYLPALCRLLVGVEEPEEQDKLCSDFREIVGSIVLLANPLSMISLSQLLHIPKRKVDHQLHLLHSVLSVPSDPRASVTLFHLSFREFLVKETHSDLGRPFAINEVSAHRHLAERCLALLQNPEGLCKDICQLGRPGAQREEIDKTTIIKYIPPHLQYACRYWIYHLQHSEQNITDGDIFDRFLQQHFLHWLECMSLINKISESIGLIDILQSLVLEDNNSQISTFLQDARRFVLTFNYILAQAPLQVYGSAWHFSPLKSIIRFAFQDQSLQNTRVAGGVPDQWNACLQTYEGHLSLVSSVVFSPDGSRVASGSHDETVRVWDVRTGECQHTLEGHSDWVTSVVFSPDGSRVASGSDDKTVRVWDVRTGECQHTLEGHSGSVRSVVFSPDGSRAASGSDDKTVRVWDVRTGECQHTLEGHSGWVTSVVFSPDGSRVASGSDDKTVRVWDVQTGECQHTLEGHSGWVWSVVFSPDGSRVASGSHDKTVRVWDAQTGECQHTLEGHSGSVWSVVFSPDGSRIASGSHDKTVRVWDAQTGECQHTLEGHSGSFTSVVFSPDGSRVASGSHDNTVRVWDVQTGECQHTLEGHSGSVTSVVFSPDGSRVASGSYDKTVRVWDVQTGECQHTLEGHSGSVTSVVFSPDGSRVASGSHDNTVRVWDVRTGECQHTLEGHSGWVRSVVFSPDGSRVASGSDDDTVRVWDVQTGECQHTLEGHSGSVTSVVFSPDGSRVASGSDDKTVRVWDAQTGECQHTLEGHSGWVWSVVFSPDGSRIASGSHDETVRVWDAQTGECQHTLEGHSGWFRSVVFSPDGSRVALGSHDNTVRVWDVRTGECQHTLEGHSGSVTSVVFSPDGLLVASGSDDNTVRVWDVRTGECQHTLEGHSGSVRSVVFSPDGLLVASGSDDNTVRVWDMGNATQLLCHDTSTYNHNIEFSADSTKIVVNSTLVSIPSRRPLTETTVMLSEPILNLPGCLGINGEWVMWASERILWLPPEYRPTSWASHKDVAAIGSGAGRVTFMHLVTTSSSFQWAKWTRQ